MRVNGEQILQSYLDTIYGISNKEYQERVWVRGEGPECDDFTETVCHFFDDGDPVINHYRDYEITYEQYQLLKKFRDDFRVFSDQYNEAFEFINTSEWAEIMEKAKAVLKAFNYIKKPESTRPQ